jgi:hypothetical protein
MDVVQDTAGDDRVEGAGILERLERDALVRRTLRRFGVDREDVVAGRREFTCDAALVPATNFEHAPGCRR